MAGARGPTTVMEEALADAKALAADFFLVVAGGELGPEERIPKLSTEARGLMSSNSSWDMKFSKISCFSKKSGRHI